MNQNSISLNKFISSTGMCSRREADRWILAGRVRINGHVARKGNRVGPRDSVTVDGSPINDVAPEPTYIAFHKPEGITCTTDLKDKTNIISYINHHERIFPVGRLDKATSGLIILTNNGDIVNKILRVENNHEKEYFVAVNKSVTPSFLRGMAKGVPMLGTVTKPCVTHQLGRNTFSIILTQGLNRQIRRMCEHFDFKVIALTRMRIMDITLGKLKKGHWRNLSKNELKMLDKKLAQV